MESTTNFNSCFGTAPQPGVRLSTEQQRLTEPKVYHYLLEHHETKEVCSVTDLSGHEDWDVLASYEGDDLPRFWVVEDFEIVPDLARFREEKWERVKTLREEKKLLAVTPF